MNYEQKYREALERAREIHRNEDDKAKDMEFIFPELKKSEDERIRKGIIDFLKTHAGYMNPCQDWDFRNRWMPWLEKQKSVGEIVERCKTSWYNEGKIQGQIEGLSDEEKYQQGWHDALEKQGEQKTSYTTLVETGDGGINALVTRELLTDGCDDEQKPVWSEEDESICNAIINDITNDKRLCKYEISKGICDAQINWLKSLKQRIKGG